MRSDFFLRLGLLLLLGGLVGPAFNSAITLASEERMDSLQGTALQVAAASFAMALVLAIFEKIGVRVAMGRCRVCRKQVQHGHALCHDHLRELQHRGRERLHANHGGGC